MKARNWDYGLDGETFGDLYEQIPDHLLQGSKNGGFIAALVVVPAARLGALERWLNESSAPVAAAKAVAGQKVVGIHEFMDRRRFLLARGMSIGSMLNSSEDPSEPHKSEESDSEQSKAAAIDRRKKTSTKKKKPELELDRGDVGSAGDSLPISPEQLEAVLYPPDSLAADSDTPADGPPVKKKRKSAGDDASVRDGAGRNGSGRDASPGSFDGERSNNGHSGNPNRLPPDDHRFQNPRGNRKPPSLFERLQKIVAALEEKLLCKEFKPSVSDWIRLVELEKEWTKTEGPREVHVKWITPTPLDIERIFGPRKPEQEDLPEKK